METIHPTPKVNQTKGSSFVNKMSKMTNATKNIKAVAEQAAEIYFNNLLSKKPQVTYLYDANPNESNIKSTFQLMLKLLFSLNAPKSNRKKIKKFKQKKINIHCIKSIQTTDKYKFLIKYIIPNVDNVYSIISYSTISNKLFKSYMENRKQELQNDVFTLHFSANKHYLLLLDPIAVEKGISDTERGVNFNITNTHMIQGVVKSLSCGEFKVPSNIYAIKIHNTIDYKLSIRDYHHMFMVVQYGIGKAISGTMKNTTAMLREDMENKDTISLMDELVNGNGVKSKNGKELEQYLSTSIEYMGLEQFEILTDLDEDDATVLEI